MHDKRRRDFLRAGSESSRIGHENAKGLAHGKTNSHMNESKKSQDKSYFYNYYPDENYTQANKSLKRGNVQELSFVSCLTFK